jgi:hypothetical protein
MAVPTAGLVYPTTVWVEPHENGGQRLRCTASRAVGSLLLFLHSHTDALYPLKLRHCRMDTYGGEDVIITTKERDIELVPRLNETVCLIFDNGDSMTSAVGAGSFVNGDQPVQVLQPKCSGISMLLREVGLILCRRRPC